jgi:hypothetical protein
VKCIPLTPRTASGKHLPILRLWSSALKNYAYFEDEYGLLVDHTEGLGSALALLEFDDVDRNDAILESTYTTEYGIPCLWPQFKYSANVWEWRVARHYHNGRLWPFVQGYWAMAAAHHGRVDLFSEALKGLTALSQIGEHFILTAYFLVAVAISCEIVINRFFVAHGFIIAHGFFI